MGHWITDQLTKEQLDFFREILTPKHCHVTGCHNPNHFEQGKYVCEIQKRECYDKLREILGFGDVHSHESYFNPNCYYCKHSYFEYPKVYDYKINHMVRYWDHQKGYWKDLTQPLSEKEAVKILTLTYKLDHDCEDDSVHIFDANTKMYFNEKDNTSIWNKLTVGDILNHS